MSLGKTIFVDIDETVAGLVEVWLARYNKDYNDTLSIYDIKEWAIASSVKPEARPVILNYLASRTLYNEVKPLPHAVEAIHYLRDNMGLHVVFASSCAYDSFQDKINWLIRHKFVPTDDQEEARNYFVGVKDKSLLSGAVLIDDRPENINNFNGHGLLFTRPYNTTAYLRSSGKRVQGWIEAIQAIRDIYDTRKMI